MLDQLLTMFKSLDSGMQTAIVIALVVSVIILVFCLILRLFRVAVGVAIFILVVPSVFTVIFGNGGSIVGKAAQYFDPETGQQITESYDYFKEKDSQLPGVNVDKITEDWEAYKDNIINSK